MREATALRQAIVRKAAIGERHAAPRPIEEVRSPYQHIEIVRHPLYGNQLYIDGDLQISESDQSYNVAMTAPLFRQPDCRRVAILGGGDGGVLNELLRAADATGLPIGSAVLIDIDAEVIAVARRHLSALCGSAFDDPRARVIIGDALSCIERERDLDAVIYDLTMDPVREDQPRATFIATIVARMAKALRPNGVLSMQVGDARDAEIVGETRAAIEACFDDIIEQRLWVPSYAGTWTFLAARKPANSAA